MPVIKCPFCQHENKPGTRFCSECGASIHLKICSNPECGKISDVGAVACEFCGQSFPNVEVAPIESASADVAAVKDESSEALPTAEKKQMGTRTWPLIMVALVAGGLPMLWANRAQLPTPKTWQLNTPDAPKAVSAEPALSIKIEPPASASPVPAAPPVAEAVSSQTGVAGSAPKVEPIESKKKTQRKKPSNGDAARKAAKPPVKEPEPAHPCTEATVALGLCDPKIVK